MKALIDNTAKEGHARGQMPSIKGKLTPFLVIMKETGQSAITIDENDDQRARYPLNGEAKDEC